MSGVRVQSGTSPFLPIYQFAAEDNTKINHLEDFADQLLAKCMLGQMIGKYMVPIAKEQKLLMMRPYQIYAVKAIRRLDESAIERAKQPSLIHHSGCLIIVDTFRSGCGGSH
ncbi:hypothetical protein SAE02_78460 [Skermanella aerolata]|uniref:Uncharacterized protein n=1 Tax=Skermanella aerolata TaxID=393310 RepID=A0A512E4P7_9PROT|nr:hypothetical protein [Skermanella aerolata]KJB89957.1 hypothetical protein N826_07605 [Skermanella aerolata KACC 11604]GEO43698.1 hypothetical protein SAE02_78460 [Skermanella aerolata]